MGGVSLESLLTTGLEGTSPAQAALALLLAFALGQVIAVVYDRTYEGLSYQRSFVQTLVLGAVVAAVLMLAIGDNLARGLGILGTMALVRFRTNVRDARDMIFVFASLAVGVATGVQSYGIAAMGTVAFSLAAVAVEWTPFGRQQHYDGMLRFWMPREAAQADVLRAVLDRHCRAFTLVALRDGAQGEVLEYAYQVRMRRGAVREALVTELQGVGGVGGISLLLQDASVPV
ncbi:MAG: DUF4956 domain-containing protein [Myxococcales bacterium]|nr:DUF4956 domain-containing protein [Myxococcales bacterium]